ncbi:hypothetical protein A3D05_05480 [Candidatus Gottesmanbacteria bacterium RIFCSPHIGHO2_02_FULL_40_24]|uniref:HypC/HybG/HupF family hydrogenase formation chaperone n=1 Tax=Candidatus Gottesmanbacteria bacterium RIFCSPHIGHO2_01_FULL_40_15 TaxID=1798376 RepID=A0A1F5Z6T8_9BACT|nr:MAG: hypothetical protein A2777_02115 [Candidatus Gottesmanbacteria bacterium RIFCSPHIGHO2_01_FULL_40_15]OGG16481.1 MAG: hypothetical protein A3D05_05480 [Candidatus Gottesmanbacteria bacterium RIFCSPHIGHO2_02_FULL_40_24]OGG22761.1 MAG: hypothetical protein A3B48_03110 [Candidatus Gottesmanbacteria bacterium RIFCSPLOWO2_01_FULL_40_10]OGG25594.1 MAG: hypothetical protein A3E42_04630 [Candidatus Gottesmanbacteria bacterium RIFCSPHIGHO2_12_FULL_40_13]OGG32599.1 MAG: hypothetical protein A3I80_0
MCFSIPYRVEKIVNKTAILEGGKKAGVDENLKVKKGDYLQIAGNMAVRKISAGEGLKIRRLIKTLYNNGK